MTRDDYINRITETVELSKRLSGDSIRAILESQGEETTDFKYEATIFRLYTEQEDGRFRLLTFGRYISAEDRIEPITRETTDENTRWLHGIKVDGWVLDDYINAVADLLYKITSNTELFPEGSYKLLWFGQDEED